MNGHLNVKCNIAMDLGLVMLPLSFTRNGFVGIKKIGFKHELPLWDCGKFYESIWL
jgi:hypothetical protein